MAIDERVNYHADELLLGYQRHWIADTASLKIAEKSRRIGLTWAEAADAALSAASAKKSGGTNHFYVGSNKEMAREFIDAVAMWSQAFNYAASEIAQEIFNDEDKDILTFVVYFSSGFKVQALSSNPRNLRGMQGNVTIDEAAFHERLDEVLKAATALTIWGAKIRIISTHNGVDSVFNQLIQDSRAGRKRYSIHTITLDDACQDGLYQRICQMNNDHQWTQAKENAWKAGLLKDTATEEDALEEYYCVPKHSAGAYIPRLLLDKAANPELKVIRFIAPQSFMDLTESERVRSVCTFNNETLTPCLTALNSELTHSFGADFARKGDLSVFSICAILGDTTRQMVLTLELINMPHLQQAQLMHAMLFRTPRLLGIAIDATGSGSFLAENAVVRYGTGMVDAVMLNDNYYREWMPKYKMLFESGYIQIPKNEEIINDQRKIQVIRGVPKIEKGSEKSASGVQRHGDSAVAYFLAVRASYMEDGLIEYTPLPKNLNELQDDGLHVIKDKGCL